MVPEFAIGYVRDIRVRWACEEAGIPYKVELVSASATCSDEYLREQPFGQVPVLRDGELVLFETGAMLLHIGSRAEKILSTDEVRRARTTAWIFAALNTIEPFAQNYIQSAMPAANVQNPEAPSSVESALKRRLTGLDGWLQGRDFLEGDFSIADVAMATVLRELTDSGVLEVYPDINRYLQTCLRRACFKKALSDQVQLYTQV